MRLTLLNLIFLATFAEAQDLKPEIVSKEKILQELSREYESPPPGARGIDVVPAPSVAVILLFKHDSTELADSQSEQQLKEVATALKDAQLNKHKFIVQGHTDSDGAADYNVKLSLRRAEAIIEMLSRSFDVPKEMLRPEGKGKTDPVADNETEAGKLKNRRVVFIRAD